MGLFDAGLYVQDDWRVKPNITLSYGLRFESQNDIPDHADWAPRVALAWGLARGKNPAKTVLRAGWGIFYDRFGESSILQANRVNGEQETQFFVNNPSFYPTVPPPDSPLLVGATATSVPSVYQIGPNLHAPYTMQTALTLERQISKVATLSTTYLNSRGIHQLFTNNIDTPEAGTFVPGSTAFPNGTYRLNDGKPENIYEFESGGIFKENQLIVNANVRAGAKVMLFGYYTLTYYNSDTSGVGSSPSNPFNLLEDYGRAAQDVRNRFFLGGSIALPYGFRISPFMTASSGRPFNVTIPNDLIGSGVLNQRPAFASSLSNPTNVFVTALGSFDSVPEPGETIVPINAFTGPDSFSLNMRVSKTFGFGKQAETAGGNRGGGGAGHDHGGGGRGGPGGPWGGGKRRWFRRRQRHHATLFGHFQRERAKHLQRCESC